MKSVLKKLKNSVEIGFSSISKKRARLPILFVHTPKTAGTSFRKAALKSRLIEEVICDYGKDNPTTSDALNRVYYHENKIEKMETIFSQDLDVLATGHFPVDKHSKHFYPYQIGIFIRDPVERVFSNFYHKVRNEQFSGTLEDFIKTNHAINLQYRYFGKLPLEFFGFIGISEKYEQSLELANRIYRLDLKVLQTNSNPNKKTKTYDKSVELAKQIEDINVKEVMTYKRANHLFETRLKQTNVKFPLYGSWEIKDKNLIKGRAYRGFTDSPVEVCLFIDDVMIAQTKAVLDDPIPADVRQPRGGFIGFEFDIEGLNTSKSNVKVIGKDFSEPLINLSSLR